MKLIMIMVMGLILGTQHVSAGEHKRRDACEKIPKWALEVADTSLRSVYPSWKVTQMVEYDSEWRCRTNGAYVRWYDKTADDKQTRVNIPLYVSKDGSIYICDSKGCFSIDRWK